MVDTVPGAELVKVFTEAQLSQEDCALVSQKFDIDTVKKFVDIFDPEDCHTPFRPQMVDKIPEWERQLGKVGRLRDALKIASEWEAPRSRLSPRCCGAGRPDRHQAARGLVLRFQA